MSSTAVSAIRILLVEDNPADIRMTVELLREGKLSNHLDVVRDGEEALRFLRREGEVAEAVRPDLILLDLDLPGLDGREVLARIKSDPAFQEITVAVLTSSEEHQDVVRSYDLHADAFINKPIDVDQLMALVREIDRLWLAIVDRPR
jgi:two-component system, chemotaxis family, response regulator Rcp1